MMMKVYWQKANIFSLFVNCCHESHSEFKEHKKKVFYADSLDAHLLLLIVR